MSLGGWLRRRWYLLLASVVAEACEAPAGCEELARWKFLDPGSGHAYRLCTTHANDPATVDGLVPMQPVRQRR